MPDSSLSGKCGHLQSIIYNKKIGNPASTILDKRRDSDKMGKKEKAGDFTWNTKRTKQKTDFVFFAPDSAGIRKETQ
jgi:hypothetical protein